MNKGLLIATLAVGVLFLLGCGIVSAEAPAKDSVKKVTFIHYRDDNGNTHEKVVTSDARVNPSQTKNPKSDAGRTPVPTKTATPTPTPVSEPAPLGTPEPTPEVTAEPTPEATAEPTPEVTAEPTPEVTAEPIPEITVEPTPTPAESALYKLKTYKWTQFPVRYYVKPNVADLNPGSVIDQVIAAFDTWDSAVPIGLCEYAGTTDSVIGMNGRSEIHWVDFGDTRILGQTSVYYSADRILEADMKLNSRMGWGIDTDGEGTQYTLTGLFDVQNIATHEAGHVFGLADLYDTAAADLTMYGYAGAGEVKRTSLGYGDLLGIQALYGA